MVMGTGIRDIHSMVDGFTFDDFFPDQNSISTSKLAMPEPFIQQNHMLDIPFHPSGLIPSGNPSPPSNISPQGDSGEESEIFSDIVLSYISQMLMEEDNTDVKIDTYQENPALRETEKPFYEILSQTYSNSSTQPPFDASLSSESPDDSIGYHPGNSSGSGSSTNSSLLLDNGWHYSSSDYPHPQVYPGPIDFSSQSSFGSTTSVSNVLEVLDDPLDGVADLFLESQPEWQFQKGVEEAQKFLPSVDKLVIDLEANGVMFPVEQALERKLVEVKSEKEEKECPFSFHELRGRKNPHSDDLELEEGRSLKQSAINYSEETLRSEMFDIILLCSGDRLPKAVTDLRGACQNEINKASQNGHAKGAGGGKAKGRGKKQPKKEVVDLRTLLIHCAQTVAADDRRSVLELLKQIRQHSSPYGDGSQRLAHCFADGIEARLAGTGSQIYHTLKMKRRTATDVLKAYRLYHAACPFKKMTHYFSHQTILDAAKNAARVHVIDFGIYYGFQWPSFMQRLSCRPGGAPKLRITGIDHPQAGFRPSERIEETGRRLAEYAQSFSIPFEYNAIASKFEDVRIEDLSIDKDELLVVNALFNFRYLADETVAVDCPRNKVLNTIRRMNPDVFIHGIVNGSYSAPFFVTRFREALFHYSALFDMLETNVPREDEQRLCIEREIFGREAINVIACEGLERVERPETYKQWQVRNLRAGFVQLPLNQGIMKKARSYLQNNYHKDFVVDEDSRWLLQGWKGRIVYALSTWKPNDHC